MASVKKRQVNMRGLGAELAELERTNPEVRAAAANLERVKREIIASAPKPVRVQLSRRKGWRKPSNTIVVSRPSKWGNPFRVGDPDVNGMPMSPERAVERYRLLLLGNGLILGAVPRSLIRRELRGKNLACWCPPGPCHADVLIAIANDGGGR